MNKKNDNRVYTDYTQDILDSLTEAPEFIRGMSFDEFADDKKTINAVIRSLEVMGEAVKNIPESIKKDYSEVPWKRMAGNER